MKYIPFKTYNSFRTADTIKMIMNQNPRGMMLDEMRKRIAVMDKVDACPTHVILTADEFTLLSDAIKSFPFGLAHKDLLALIDDVLAADEPPAIVLQAAKAKANGKEAIA